MPTTPEMLVEELLRIEDEAEQRRYLKDHQHLLGDGVVQAMKAKSDEFMVIDINRTMELGELILYTATLTGDPLQRAIGLRAKGNAARLLGQYERSLDIYDEADRIYVTYDEPVLKASNQIGRINTLMNLGRYEEALRAAAEARQTLVHHEEWSSAATLDLNTAMIHSRLGGDQEALNVFDRARDIYSSLGEEAEPYVAWVDLNRSIVLRNLGDYQGALEACRAAHSILKQRGQKTALARLHQSFGTTYFFMGRYNEALQAFDRARELFDEKRDLALVALFISDCYLQLNRLDDVVEKCQTIRQTFTELGTRYEVAQAICNEAIAYTKLGQFDKAVTTFSEARSLFEEEGIDVLVATAGVELARLLSHQKRYDEALEMTQQARQVLQEHQLPMPRIQAELIAAQALCALGRVEQAMSCCRKALELAKEKDLPWLLYQGHRLLGQIAESRQDLEASRAYYARAIEDIERLRGHLAIEFRAPFLTDKEDAYQGIVTILLEMGEWDEALKYVERAKSRALVDLLAHDLDIRIQTRDAGDHALIEQVKRLRQEYDWYCRRIGRHEESGDGLDSLSREQDALQREMRIREKQITELLDRLQVRNAAYAEPASLLQVQIFAPQPYLDEDTALLEFYIVRDQVIAFSITDRDVQVHRHLLAAQQLGRWLQLFRLNVTALESARGADNSAHLARNAQGLLHRFYQALIDPLAFRLRGRSKVIVVPHGLLHYLPFHAMYDGKNYLMEKHEFSYLPASSLLKFSHEKRSSGQEGALVLAYSDEGRLPFVLEEAQAVASLLNGDCFVEAGALSSKLQGHERAYDVIHLAAHGEFRADNPLFSAIQLADARLTTMDLFNLSLPASLVVLSACESGANVISGGDELIGLSRALLYAGASSLMLSLWRVEDRSTALLMREFYTGLKAGRTKGGALRQAQRELMSMEEERGGVRVRPYQHPYFWAPFFLVGANGVL
ncbi:MAG: CHAT domain-containing protein [Anaerolineae bacterium]